MRSFVDYYYRDLVDQALRVGLPVRTRNADVKRLLYKSFTFRGTPLVCLRKTAWKNCLREWEWFMSGSNRIEDLHPDVRPWWRPWANTDTEPYSGAVFGNYSRMFRHWADFDIYGRFTETFDQIRYLIEGVKNHPHSRRNVITTWDSAVAMVPECKITNCHGTVIQASVGDASDPDALHLFTYQRSVDLIVGLPHNWLQYWAFLLWLAHRTGRTVGSLTWTGGDIHLYERHYELAGEVSHAQPTDDTPNLVYTPTSEDFRADDFRLDREYQPKILTRAEMVV